MIMVCELGDETFIIAAIMAMRHPRALVLGGALGALYVMTVLSTALGTVAPYLISRTMVNRVAAMLYTFFGLRLMYIAYRSDANETPAAEMEEVEEKLKEGPAAKAKGGMRKLLAAALSPVFVETFVLTFLAEWGDRSQIATIALGAHRNPYAVCVGAIVGHTICTGLAVWGGRLLALKFSQRMVAFTGGLLFLAFALHAAIYGVAGG
jgi:putative Ca2+/H+ antiporter (TMEM165/GDT1 family)